MPTSLTANTKINSYGNKAGGTGNPAIYTRAWTVTTDAAAGVKTIKVTVSWNASTASEKNGSITLTTKKAADK
jgi:hypothetical protein